MAKTIEQRLHDLEEKYRIISDNLIDAVFVIDAEKLTFEFITPSIQRLSGFPAESYSQKTILDRVAEEHIPQVKEIMSLGRADFDKGDARRHSFEVQLTHSDGHPYWIEVIGRFFRDTDGQVKVVGLVRDINHRKQVEHEQEALIARLNRALEDKEALLKENRVLRGLLPICAACKRIRDENGRWWPLDAYVASHTDAELTHTICGDCRDVMYPSPSQG